MAYLAVCRCLGTLFILAPVDFATFAALTWG
jgi:hypothetical protein